jgi:hypothetical protein
MPRDGAHRPGVLLKELSPRQNGIYCNFDVASGPSINDRGSRSPVSGVALGAWKRGTWPRAAGVGWKAEEDDPRTIDAQVRRSGHDSRGTFNPRAWGQREPKNNSGAGQQRAYIDRISKHFGMTQSSSPKVAQVHSSYVLLLDKHRV